MPLLLRALPRETDAGSPAVAVVEALRGGAKELSPSLLEAISPVVPTGEYRACLLDLHPELVWPGGNRDYFSDEHVELFGFDSWWGLPHYPRTPSYRAGDFALSKEQKLFEFVVPLVPPRFLDSEVVAEYMHGNSRSAALALSVLDVKTPADPWIHADRGLPYPPPPRDPPVLYSHVCLVHYLLDGHHKTYAAADAGRSMHLVSLVALEAGGFDQRGPRQGADCVRGARFIRGVVASSREGSKAVLSGPFLLATTNASL